MRRYLTVAVAGLVLAFGAAAQTANDLAVLKGLAPMAALPRTEAGRAALHVNYRVTGGIQSGAIAQPTLLPFAQQQQQALRDAFMATGNFTDLAEGLGTTLSAAYSARAHYLDRSKFTSVAQSVQDVMAYAYATTSANSNSGKFFFANATTNGKDAVSAEAQSILAANQGLTDVYGISYALTAGSAGADKYGNSRPFQTEPGLTRIAGPDYVNEAADNTVYNRGPIMDLTNSPSFPSGHTTYGYTAALTLAVLVPERYQEMVARGAEYGNDRILMGAHYAMDVLSGRTVALYGMAHLLANDAKYMGQPFKTAPALGDFQAAMRSARASLVAVLESACGKTVAQCAREDTGRLKNAAANEAFYAATQTYGLPVVHQNTAGVVEDVGKVAPEAGYLLTVAFPSISLEEANRILTETEGPGGGFLNDGSGFGVYSRLNLYAAAGKAAKLAAGR